MALQVGWEKGILVRWGRGKGPEWAANKQVGWGAVATQVEWEGGRAPCLRGVYTVLTHMREGCFPPVFDAQCGGAELLLADCDPERSSHSFVSCMSGSTPKLHAPLLPTLTPAQCACAHTSMRPCTHALMHRPHAPMRLMHRRMTWACMSSAEAVAPPPRSWQCCRSVGKLGVGL